MWHAVYPGLKFEDLTLPLFEDLLSRMWRTIALKNGTFTPEMQRQEETDDYNRKILVRQKFKHLFPADRI